MTAITYTAKRNIPKNAFIVSAGDISVVAATFEFNSTSTDLSSAVVGEYIYITGFTETGNNGWFEVVSKSANQIIVNDPLAVLVDEVAGDLINMQGYIRGEGVDYTLDSGVSELTPDDVPDTDTRISLSGIETTLLHRIDEYWNIQTIAVPETDRLQWKEFIASVAAGESFTFDAFGTSVTPDDPINCKIIGKGIMNRLQNSDYFQIGFRVKKV